MIFFDNKTKTLFFSTMCLVIMLTLSSAYAEEMEEWINIRGETVKVFSSSVEKLLEYGYLDSKIIKFESKISSIEYTSDIEILDVSYVEPDMLSLIFNITALDVAQNITMSIPRNVLDSTYDYDDENDTWKTRSFIVIINEEEILNEEIKTLKTNRIISFEIPPNSSQFEIYGTCIPENCHVDLDSYCKYPGPLCMEWQE